MTAVPAPSARVKCNQNMQACDFAVDSEQCPVMGTCLKYRLKPEELLKLARTVDAYQSHQNALKFFVFVGDLVKKMRTEKSHG